MYGSRIFWTGFAEKSQGIWEIFVSSVLKLWTPINYSKLKFFSHTAADEWPSHHYQAHLILPGGPIMSSFDKKIN